MGRPLLYGTTPGFLEQFALRHLGELPRADELAVALRDPHAPLPSREPVEAVEAVRAGEQTEQVETSQSGLVESTAESNGAAPDAESPYASAQG